LNAAAPVLGLDAMEGTVQEALRKWTPIWNHAQAPLIKSSA